MHSCKQTVLVKQQILSRPFRHLQALALVALWHLVAVTLYPVRNNFRGEPCFRKALRGEISQPAPYTTSHAPDI